MNTKGRTSRFLPLMSLSILAFILCAGRVSAGDEPNDDQGQKRSTAEEFLRLNVRPIAIGHHG